MASEHGSSADWSVNWVGGLVTSLIAGSLLVAANHWDALLGNRPLPVASAAINYVLIFLTYIFISYRARQTHGTPHL